MLGIVKEKAVIYWALEPAIEVTKITTQHPAPWKVVGEFFW